MQITICFYTGYRVRYGNKRDLILEENATLRDLLQRLSLTPEEVGIMMLNGKNVSSDAVLHHGDTLSLFQHMAGG